MFCRILLLCSFLLSLPYLPAQCGGVERWPVKVGGDPGAASIDLAHPIPLTLHQLVALPRPALPEDDITRTPEESHVYVVEGRLLKFKPESGRTGDSDYHLVITDDTLQFSQGAHVSPHSFIAEIARPECVAGRQGAFPTPSHFQTQLAAVVAKFEAKFSPISGGWNDPQGIPVRITGVGFFDRPHGQTGRALNGIELHPILDIEFLDGTPVVPTPVAPGSGVTPLLLNPGFEDGPKIWVGSDEVISRQPGDPPRTGAWRAWFGGTGQTRTDTLYQQVTIPATATVANLGFYLHVSTEELESEPFDKLQVELRTTGNQLIKRLATYSNVDAAPGFWLKSFDLTPYKGRTLRIYLRGTEDKAKLTSFILDDFLLVIE